MIIWFNTISEKREDDEEKETVEEFSSNLGTTDFGTTGGLFPGRSMENEKKIELISTEKRKRRYSS